MDRAGVRVVVGGSIEVGLACAVKFAEFSEAVVIVDADDERVKQACKQVEAKGAKSIAVVTPLEDMAALAAIPATAGIDRCDTLVNCQLAVERSSIADLKIENWERVVRINLTGPLVAAKALMPLLAATPGASIVNVSTVDGILGNPMLVAYSASKGGLITLTQVMGYEFGGIGVRVNCVARSGSTQSGGIVPLDPKVVEAEARRAKLTPLGRLGHPDETADAILFLASEQASFINGTTLRVDGGRTVITPGCP